MCKKLICLISVVVLTGLVLTSAANAADPNLIGWWKFDEGSGTTCADSSDNNNVGTFGIDGLGNPDANNDPEWVDGRRGTYALFFDGKTIDSYGNDIAADFVACGNDVSLDVNGPFTVMAWIRGPLDDWTANTIAIKGDSWALLMWSNYRIRWDIKLTDYNDPCEGYYGPGLKAEMQPGIYTGWHHLAGTWDQSVSTLYYDGIVADSNSSLPGTHMWIDSNQLCFGAEHYPDSVGRVWKGYIDDVRIYDYNMTQAEIQAIYNLPYDIASNPRPADGAEKGLTLDGLVTMRWVESPNATSHDVYFGTTNPPTFIRNQTPADNNSYTPASALSGDTTYYWRIGEKNGGTYLGPVWSFTVENYVVVDDFESYSTSGEVNEVWVHSYAALVQLNIDEQHNGDRSMRLLYYNNSSWGSYSEANNTFAATQDWSQNNLKALTLYFLGTSTANNADDLYVILRDSLGHSAMVAHPDNPNAILETTKWQEWNIPLTDFKYPAQTAANDVNLTKIKHIVIGIGDRYVAGSYAEGEVSFDDVRLYPQRCVYSDKPETDLTGDCKTDYKDVGVVSDEWLATSARPVLWYKLDEVHPNDVNWFAGCEVVHDSSGNGYNGVINDPNKFSDEASDPCCKSGGCVHFRRDNDIRVPIEALSSIEDEITIAFWANGDPCANSPSYKKDADCAVSAKFGYADFDRVLRVLLPEPNDTDSSGPREVLWYAGNPDTGYNTVQTSGWKNGSYRGHWHHYAFTKNVDSEEMYIYIDGVLKAAGVAPTDKIYGATSLRLGNITLDLQGGGRSYCMIGRMDDFRIYNYALPLSDIQRLASTPSLEPLPRPDFDVSGSVNFKDFATLGNAWLEEVLFP